MKTAILAAMCTAATFIVGSAAAQEPATTTQESIPVRPPKPNRHGFAIAGGFGHQFSGIGVQGSFYVQIPGCEYIRLVPYYSIGTFPYAEKKTQPGFATGLMGHFGDRNHWGVVDLSYGLAGVVEEWQLVSSGNLGDPGYNIDVKVVGRSILYAPTLAGGYEYMADGGFFVRPMAGVSLMPTVPHQDGYVTWTGTLALGWKVK